MGLGICFDEGYEPITCMMHYSADTGFTPCLAMLMIVLQNDDWLPLTLTGVLNIASVKVAVVAIVPANWTDALLFVQQFGSVVPPLVRGHEIPFLSSPRSQLTSTPSTSARAL